MHPQHAPVSLERLVAHLNDLFDIGQVEKLELLDAGYMCQNFEVVCASGRFFLKQYRHRFSQWVSEIKYAERFFSEYGVPVLLPLNDRFGRPCFWFEGNWFSLFPFIEGKTPNVAELSDDTIKSLATILARMHQAGEKVETPERFQKLHLWSPETFKLEFVELEQGILKRGELTELDERMLNHLRVKRDVVEANQLQPGDIHLPNDRLLHGDFIYQNTFIEQSGEISHVFDFEQTCFGPRAYDLARSILMNCFDDGWSEKHLRQAQLFLSTYREIYPISFDEFMRGLRVYMTHLSHTTWVEAKYILFNSTVYLPIHEARMRRIINLGSEDAQREFAKKLYIS